MKKIFTLLVLSLLCVFCAIGLAACENKKNITHNTANTNSTSETIPSTNNTPSSENDVPAKTYYTVTFNSNGGTKIDPIQIEEGQKCPSPDTPQNTGYALDGWYYENEKWSFIGYTVTEDITLTAKWSINENYLDIFDWEKNDDKYIINGIKDKNITYITLPGYISSIGNNAFENCTNLKYINIGKGITDIGYHAFENCNRLYNIFYYGTASQWAQINGLVWITGHNRSLHIIDNEQMKNSEINNLHEVILENLYEIKDSAFSCCTLLYSVTIKDGVKIIDEFAFNYCINLYNFTIPNSITNINNYAFFLCNSLKSISYNGTKEQWNNIIKGNYWNNGSSITQIICTDGAIDL